MRRAGRREHRTGPERLPRPRRASLPVRQRVDASPDRGKGDPRRLKHRQGKGQGQSRQAAQRPKGQENTRKGRPEKTGNAGSERQAALHDRKKPHHQEIYRQQIRQGSSLGQEQAEGNQVREPETNGKGVEFQRRSGKTTVRIGLDGKVRTITVQGDITGA